MKLLIILLAGFIAGVFAGAIYENRRLLGEPDTTVAVFISKNAIDNARHAKKSLAEYRSLLANGKLEALQERWEFQEQIFSEIEANALAVCDDPDTKCKE